MTDQLKESAQRDQASGWADLQYDHRDPQVVYSPYSLWKRLRQQCPVIHSDRYGGFWFVSGYEDVKTVQNDWETFTSTEGINIPRLSMLMLPGEVDPPLHREYRRIANPLLSPQVVRKHESWIRELARVWVAKIAAKDHFDAATEFCEPFGTRVGLRTIGFEIEDLDRLGHWTGVLVGGDRDSEEGLRASQEFFAHITETLERRAGEPPRDDLISAIVNGQVDNRPLTMEEQQSMLLELTFGGLHTTGAVLAGALVWLAGHPEDRARLRDDPGLMTTAVEEFIRYVTPVAHMSRTAAKDTTLRGCPIHAGDKVMFGLGSANRDETVFDSPDEVMLDRFPNRHFAFGAGPHRCVGSHLAKVSIRVGLEEFLGTFRDFKVTDYYELRWNGGEAHGLLSAPLTITRR